MQTHISHITNSHRIFPITKFSRFPLTVVPMLSYSSQDDLAGGCLDVLRRPHNLMEAVAEVKNPIRRLFDHLWCCPPLPMVLSRGILIQSKHLYIFLHIPIVIFLEKMKFWKDFKKSTALFIWSTNVRNAYFSVVILTYQHYGYGVPQKLYFHGKKF